MQSERPPWRHSGKFRYLFLAACLSLGSRIQAQNLVLPDLVLPGNLRSDIEIPFYGNEVSSSWSVVPVRYRRIYPVSQLSVHEISAVPADTGGLSELPVSGESGERTDSSTGGVTLWNVSAEYNLREGLYLVGGRAFESTDNLYAETFMPLALDGVRPWRAGLGWYRTGQVSGEMKGGMLLADNSSPYLTADFRWDRPLGAPDSYQLTVLGIGAPQGGIGGRAGAEIEIPLSGGAWSLGVLLGGGGSGGDGSGDWLADAGVFAGMKILEGRLEGKLGVQGLMQSGRNVHFNPMVSLIWKPQASFVLYADSRYEFGVEEADGALLGDWDSYDPVVPASAVYRVGIGLDEAGGINGTAELGAAYGRFLFASDNNLVVEEDTRAGIRGTLRIPAGESFVRMDAFLDYYFVSETEIWSVRAAWEHEKLEVYMEGGSADALLGGLLPGSRGEMPIICAGTGFDINSSWNLGLAAYTELPWNAPSVVINAAWRN